ncbi:hypothetical protein ABPG77_000960 [Micractinium sp. CCAP 211/92]
MGIVVLPGTDPVVAYIDEDQDNKVSVIRLGIGNNWWLGWSYVAAGLTRGPGSGLSLALSRENIPVLAFWQPSEQAGFDLCTLEFIQLVDSNRSQPEPACLRTNVARDSFVSLAFGPNGLKYLAYVEEDDRLRVAKQLPSGEWVLLGAASQVPLVPSLIMNVDLVADPLSHALLMAFTSVTPDRTAFGVGMVRWDNNGPWRIQDRWAFSGASLFRAALKLTQDRVYAKPYLSTVNDMTDNLLRVARYDMQPV